MKQKQQDDYQLPRLPPSKREIQYQKSLAKNLRDRAKQKKMVESEVDQDDDYYSKKSTEKGQKWWRKFDRRFFKSASDINLQKILSNLAPQNLVTAFQTPPQLLGSYEQSIIGARIPQILQQQSLRVLHSYQNPDQPGNKVCTLSLYIIQQSDEQELYKQQQNPNARVYPLHGKKKNTEDNQKIIVEMPKLNPTILQCIRMTDDQQLIEKCINFLLVNKSQFDNIYKESLYWQKELEMQNLENQDRIRKLLSNIHNSETNDFLAKCYLRSLITGENFLGINGPSEDPSFALSKQKMRQIEGQQIERISKYLSWMNTIKYIQYGHADKKIDMMQALLGQQQNEQGFQSSMRKKSKQQRMKKAFETDCKVCFCTQNEDKNRVVYCDKCNTSFHQICYGIKTIDKDLAYYCQTCQYLIDFQSKHKEEKLKKICCQICFKFSFPLKKVEGHFYHVTCLMMFNFGQIKDYQVCLRDTISHHDIQQAIIENEIEHQHCHFCVKSGSSSMGMRVKCMVDGCNKASHSICAYLNGAMFDIKKQGCDLQVGIVCSEHVEQRDKAQQVYLRRFFCDYKGTSRYSQEDFRSKYQLQQQQRQKNILQRQYMQRMVSFRKYKRSYLNPARIIQRTKVVNKRLLVMKQMDRGQINKNQVKEKEIQNIQTRTVNLTQKEEQKMKKIINYNLIKTSNNLYQRDELLSPKQKQTMDDFVILRNARNRPKKIIMKEKRNIQEKYRVLKMVNNSKTSIQKQAQRISTRMVDQNVPQIQQQVMNDQFQTETRKLIKQYTNANSSHSQSGQLIGLQSKQKTLILIEKPRKMAKVIQDEQYIPEIKVRR